MKGKSVKMNKFREIDNIVNLDLNGRGIKQLYESVEGSPLCLEASKIVRTSLESENPHAILTTGFPILPEGKPETDGPPGTIVLAKACEELGMNTVLVSDESFLKLYQNLSNLIKLNSIEMEKIPKNIDEAKEKCSSILSEYSPQVIISIERPGINEIGKYWDMNGEEITDKVGKVDPLFRKAEEREIPTIGVGDGGNEVGMGNIKSTVEKEIPNGSKIASKTRVQTLVTSGVSNWGAYGIVTALSILSGKDLLHDSETEESLIKTSLETGAIDSFSKESKYKVDGIPGSIHEKIVDILNFLVSSNY